MAPDRVEASPRPATAGARVYRHSAGKGGDEALEFEAADDVFFPTHTSQLLIQGVRRAIQAPGRLLDLGCGIGVCGLALAKLGVCDVPVYFSDVSERATALTRANATKHGIAAVVRQGSLFEPWSGERFDVIVDDVSGVCEDVARLSPWFPSGVECQSGPDGTTLVVGVVERAPRHLRRDGVLVFPALSLSREARILEAAGRMFGDVSLVAQQSWFLPDELLENFAKLQPLLEAGTITLEQKFGRWLWATKIYAARRPLET